MNSKLFEQKTEKHEIQILICGGGLKAVVVAAVLLKPVLRWSRWLEYLTIDSENRWQRGSDWKTDRRAPSRRSWTSARERQVLDIIVCLVEFNGVPSIGVRRISQWRGLHWWIQEFFVWVWHGEREARAYNGGPAEPPAGSWGRVPGQGVRGRSPLKLELS